MKKATRMIKNLIAIVLFGIIILAFLFWAAERLFAQSIEQTVCAAPRDAMEKQLCDEYKRLQEEEAILQSSLNVQKSESASIQRDLGILTDQIRKAQVSIEQRNLAIRRLGSDIELKDQTVSELNDKIDRSRDALAQLIRRTHQLDNTSMVEIMLAEQNLSEFFVNIDTYNQLQHSLDTLVNEIREIRGLTEEERIALERKQNAEQDVKAEIEAQKRQVEVKENEKDRLLRVSRQAEASYEQVLAEKRQRASQIRAALFQLRDVDGISFGDAVRYANAASQRTGVRSSFILAILTQESNLGKHLGSCVIYDLESGKSQGVNTGRVFNQGIHPTRDLPPLQVVLRDLGRDPLKTRISCPLITELPDGGFRESGYGGAMGPSQFIPSTWQLYMGQLRDIFGTHPDPWNPEHAIMATGLLLRDNGAAAGGYTAERTAALKYYAGGNWNAAHNAFYGNQVMNHVLDIQTKIDFLIEVE